MHFQREIVPMEDDEDLELLRLAALKSLNNKKDVPHATKPSKSVEDNRTIPVVSGVRPPNDKYYPIVADTNLVQPNVIHHPASNYLNVGFEKIDLNEQYVPSTLQGPSTFSEYVPFGVPPTMTETPNVQLSPRSAAFVNENINIMKKRRQDGMSPTHSPGRWSRSRSREYRSRRSTSLSPVYPNHSPIHHRHRSISRSPPRKRHSPMPIPQQHRRVSRSRSPRVNYEANAHRSDKRSPPNTHSNRRAKHSPNNRNPVKSWRNHSPHNRLNDLPPTSRRSGSPRVDDSKHRFAQRRRTRSPISNPKQKLEPRQRSPSRSPNRKYPRSNLNSRRRRTPPHKRFQASNGDKPNNSGSRNQAKGNDRNYNSSRRSASPAANRHSRSRSQSNNLRRKSPAKNAITEKSRRSDENEANVEKTKTIEEPKPATETKMEVESNENATKTKTELEMEDELLASTDDEKSDDDDDGIDLFASEESESENEGRFKSSSSKTERNTNVPVVSFSKLGTSAAAPAEILRDLDELQPETNFRESGSRRDNNRHNRNNSRRDNSRRYNNKKFSDRDRERDRDYERDANKNSSGSSSWKSSKGSEVTRKKENELNAENTSEKGEKSERKPILFKQTFQAIDSEPRKRTPEAGESLIFIFEKIQIYLNDISFLLL